MLSKINCEPVKQRNDNKENILPGNCNIYKTLAEVGKANESFAMLSQLYRSVTIRYRVKLAIRPESGGVLAIRA